MAAKPPIIWILSHAHIGFISSDSMGATHSSNLRSIGFTWATGLGWSFGDDRQPGNADDRRFSSGPVTELVDAASVLLERSRTEIGDATIDEARTALYDMIPLTDTLSASYFGSSATNTVVYYLPTVPEPSTLGIGLTAGGFLQFRWPSVVGLQYQLQSTTNLPTVTWLDEGAPFPGTGGLLSTNLPIGPATNKFFRLRILGN